VQVSPSFSKAPPTAAVNRAAKRRVSALWSLLLLTLMAAGCATLRPEEKEYLANPAMTWGDESIATQHELHVIENREASLGVGTASGGGCGCN
jgi:hypothetical protein